MRNNLRRPALASTFGCISGRVLTIEAALILLGQFAFSNVITPSFSFAADNENIKIAGHLNLRTAGDKQGKCKQLLPTCNRGESNLWVSGNVRQAYDIAIYLLDAAQSVSGVQFGIEYEPSLRIYSWQTCADGQFNHSNSQGVPWPASGSGNLLVFGKDTPRSTRDSDLGTTVLVGSFYVYAYDAAALKFTPYPQKGAKDPWDGSIVVTDGDLVENQVTYPDNQGVVAFGSKAGQDPCIEGVPVQSLSERAEGTSSSGVFTTSNKVFWSISSNKTREANGIIYSVTGRVVRDLGVISLSRGETRVAWEGTDNSGSRVGQGKYYLLLQGDDGFRAVRSAIIVRGNPK